MNILVCIKQVPGTNKVEVDPITGVLKRDGAEAKMNPYDLYAIETALYLKEKTGGSVTAVTMGPMQAEEIIKESYMMGVDNGYVISDRKFAGSDVLATAYAMSQGIKKMDEFDIIICGKQTTDGDTAQVGPSIAEILNIPHAAWVGKIAGFDESSITVVQDLASITQTARLSFPCLITVEKGIFEPRLPSYKKKIETKDKEVKIITFDDFIEKDDKKCGLNGSATSVERIFSPEGREGQVYLEGEYEEQSAELFKILTELKFV